jgi:hypothetical protein
MGGAAHRAQGVLKKAAIAAARKIAVAMLRLCRDGTTFAWTKEALPA